ncbi:nucleic acid-binding protein [Multifurca ochricompacta]|uniref:Nucleic acid-binding protein n=1 Tax=Multifurca ochricompacta TaxID=376703 RepID=A0AAD4QQA8_9AGAM|nr:nucleic acid-binding protein [Multifurca ochricompacta]
MSSIDAFLKLQSPLRELLVGSVQQDERQLGISEKDKTDIAQWIEKVAQSDFVKPDSLPSLDVHLKPRTYLVGNYMTAADIAVYGALQPTFAKLRPAQYHSHPALTRYFDHIQSRPSVRKSAEALAPAFDVIPLDFSAAPPVERKALETKKKEKPAKPAEDGATPISTQKTANSIVVKNSESSEVKPSRKKEKQDSAAEKDGKKKVADSGKAISTGTEDAASPIPSMIDLRVGHIIEVKKHPDADGLYVEESSDKQIDFGEETGPRTVVSGLVNYIPIEQMQDKWLVGVCNLKPANMRGVKSFAMVLCATSKDGKEAGIEIIQPPPNSKPGDRIYFEGPEYEDKAPLSQLNPKKKIFETIQPGFTTLETREAAWINPLTKSVHIIRTREGVCLAPTLVGASLS